MTCCGSKKTAKDNSGKGNKQSDAQNANGKAK